MLSEQSAFGFTGSTQRVRHGQSLREVAQAKICIDLPGNGDFCFRLIDYLAIGACIIGPAHRTVMHVPLVDREHLVHCEPDLSDLVSLCKRYLQDDDERRRMTSNARSYFDRYLHRDQLSAYYLHIALERAKETHLTAVIPKTEGFPMKPHVMSGRFDEVNTAKLAKLRLPPIDL